MSGFPMPPPNSSVLDRVKMFLPQLEQANKQLEEKIRLEGLASVQIDSHLNANNANNANLAAGGDYDSDEEEVIEEQLSQNDPGLLGVEESGNRSQAKPRKIEIEFAIGDFDGTPIAQMEEEKDGDIRDGANGNNSSNSSNSNNSSNREIIFKRDS